MTEVREQVRHAFAARLGAGHSLEDDTNFFEAGLTSVRLAELVTELRSHGTPVTLIDVFRYPTLRELTDELARRGSDRRRSDPAPGRLPWER